MSSIAAAIDAHRADRRDNTTRAPACHAAVAAKPMARSVVRHRSAPARVCSSGKKPWARRGALVNGQLVPQREVFEHQGALGPDPAEEAREDDGDHAGHHRSGRPKVNSDETDGVSRRHRWTVELSPGSTSRGRLSG